MFYCILFSKIFHFNVNYFRNKNEELPRFSSPNFTQDEIGTPILDVVLNAGDLLYFPRCYIHQGVTLQDSHSLHITLSMYQKTAWVDLLEKVSCTFLKFTSMLLGMHELSIIESSYLFIMSHQACYTHAPLARTHMHTANKNLHN